MELTLTTTDVSPLELTVGSILCDDNGTPFAVVSGKPGVDSSGTVIAPTASIPAGAFDVRGFSNDHRYMRTYGHTGVTVLPTYPLAVQWCKRENDQRTREEREVWHAYSAVYYADTFRPARVQEFDPFMSVEFPAGTTVKVVG